MRKLWAFGDSNTEVYNIENVWANDYLKWKGYSPKVYIELLSEHYNCELHNFAKSGTNNYYIFQKFCENVSNFEYGDIIVLQWSEVTRFRLVDDSNEWVDFYFNNSHSKNKLSNFNNLNIESIQQVLTNRLKNRWMDEIYAWENVVNIVLKDKKYIMWSPFTNAGGYGRWVKSMETISNETNKLIDDPHLSENGQIKLSKLLIDKLDFNKKNIV
jgi:hypothetical protein